MVVRKNHLGGDPSCQREHEEALKRGERICRECGKPVKKPRKSWCSQECVSIHTKRFRPVRSIVFDRDKGICALCSADMSDVGEWVGEKWHTRWVPGWEADHIIPLVEGGEHSLENLRTLCVPCHKAETKALRARMKARKQQVSLNLS